MSEPRKLNTGDARHVYRSTPAQNGAGRSVSTAQAHGTPTSSANDAAIDAYEQARRNAQAAAEETLRMRRVRQTDRTPRLNTTTLTPAQRQALALRQAQNVQQAQAAPPQPDPVVAPPVRRQPDPVTPLPPVAPPPPTPVPPADQKAARAAAQLYPEQEMKTKTPSRQTPPRQTAKKQGEPARRSAAQSGGKAKSKTKKRKKRLRWWQIALITLLLIGLILGGALAVIMHSIAPSIGGMTLDNMLNTPKEFQGKELNFLMIGIDRSTEDENNKDANVNDGNTDMIMYVHFNNETGELKMLQIPRDYMVTTDRKVSANFKLNNLAKTQAPEPNTLNMVALCEKVANMFQVPIDGYVAIRLEALLKLVDMFGGIELYVPETIDYAAIGQGSSKLEKGYHKLTGAQVEFFLRARKTYKDSDIGRLNAQRQFYSALFRRLKQMDNIWDVARYAGALMDYVETDLNITQLVSFAVSLLKIDSANIMICQMPCYMMGNRYYWDGRGTYEKNAQSVNYPARQAAADLLNEYFRENTGYVDASALQLCEPTSDAYGEFGVKSQMSLTDPNIQFMKDINDQQHQAYLESGDENMTVDYVDPNN